MEWAMIITYFQSSVYYQSENVCSYFGFFYRIYTMSNISAFKVFALSVEHLCDNNVNKLVLFKDKYLNFHIYTNFLHARNQ